MLALKSTNNWLYSIELLNQFTKPLSKPFGMKGKIALRFDAEQNWLELSSSLLLVGDFQYWLILQFQRQRRCYVALGLLSGCLWLKKHFIHQCKTGIAHTHRLIVTEGGNPNIEGIQNLQQSILIHHYNYHTFLAYYC